MYIKIKLNWLKQGYDIVLSCKESVSSIYILFTQLTSRIKGYMEGVQNTSGQRLEND